MTGTRLRWVTRTITAVALFGAATMAPASVSSAWAAEPKLTIDDVRVTEGNTGTWDLVFTVKLSASNSRKVTVDYATGGGSATATTDYTPKQGTVTIAAGQRSATIRVPVVGDTAQEPDETVEVRLSNPVRATIADGLGVGTIANDDAAPPPPPPGPPVLTVTTAGNGPAGSSASRPASPARPTARVLPRRRRRDAHRPCRGHRDLHGVDGGVQRDRALHDHDGRRQVRRRELHRPDPGHEASCRSGSTDGAAAPSSSSPAGINCPPSPAIVQ